MKIKVEVTKELIDNSCPRNSEYCPVNKGMAKAVPDRIWTTSASAVCDWVNHKTYDLPAEAVEFIKNFDADQPVKPFSFELEIA